MSQAPENHQSNDSVNSLLGIDTGGTFTDFVLFDGVRLHVFKCLSTPAAPEDAIIQGVEALTGDKQALGQLLVTHGSTVATNAVLENKGVSTAYITNQGLADVLTIGRQARRELYNLQPRPQPPPVPASYCLEVPQRLAADGTEIQALDGEALQTLINQLGALAPQACAINLLFSFLDETAERKIQQQLQAAFPNMFVSRSSEVLPEYREYERGMATWLNASVGPLIGRYLERLQARLPVRNIAIMHSAAGTIGIDQASKRGVNLLLSGPAGGLLAARYLGQQTGNDKLLTFDMGGTSTDVALIDGDIRLSTQGHIADWPVAVPMVDMHTIGAGGGSLATVDAGGLLQVGPESAGANPGPVCYGQGGTQATVTDANLVLGRLPASAALGGEMSLDLEAARQVYDSLARKLGISLEEAAMGVIRIANEHMVQALRVISVEKGEDPRDYALMSFGGAGGLHVCALAEAMGMQRAIVPVYAGVLSALGMLVARRSRQLSKSILRPLSEVNSARIHEALQALETRGRRELTEEGAQAQQLEFEASLDLRYVGQSNALNVNYRNPEQSQADFHLQHENRYGHRLDLPVELVNVRLAVTASEPELELPTLPQARNVPESLSSSPVVGLPGKVPHYLRDGLMAGHSIEGPAIVLESVSTTFIDAGWVAEVDGIGNLVLRKR